MKRDRPAASLTRGIGTGVVGHERVSGLRRSAQGDDADVLAHPGRGPSPPLRGDRGAEDWFRRHRLRGARAGDESTHALHRDSGVEDDPDHPRRPSGDGKRVRRPGGGRPPITERKPQLESTLHEVLETHSAVSPTDERVRWTDFKPLQLAHHLLERGFEISRNTAAALLDRAGFRRRALRKELITGVVDPGAREEQFRYIIALRCLARRRGIPVFSADTRRRSCSAPCIGRDSPTAPHASGLRSRFPPPRRRCVG